MYQTYLQGHDVLERLEGALGYPLEVVVKQRSKQQITSSEVYFV